jgi:hypothetical protein
MKKRTTLMKRLTILTALTALVAAALAAQSPAPPAIPVAPPTDPKTFFEQLASGKGTPRSHPEVMAIVGEIPKMTKAQAQELVGPVFATLKDNGDVGLNGALGLYTLARRPDSAEILKGSMKDIAALFAKSDPRFKATADFVLMDIRPTPPEAAGILLGFINGPTGTVQEKVDALSALARIDNPPAKALEAAAISIMKSPGLPNNTMAAVINAATYPGASNELIDAVAARLDNPDPEVKVQSILAIKRFGTAAVARHRGALGRLANDQSQPEPVRKFAQNALDGKDERCVTLTWGTNPKLEPIPGCK